MTNNALELAAEDLEAYHMAMDSQGVPRDMEGIVLSEYGRAVELARMAASGGWVDHDQG